MKSIIIILSRIIKLIQKIWWLFTLATLVIIFTPKSFQKKYLQAPADSVSKVISSTPQFKILKKNLNIKKKKTNFSENDVLKLNLIY